MSDGILDQLQADVYAVLSNTPSLGLTRKILDDKGGLEGRLEHELATVNDASGKAGMAVIVLAVEVDEAEENLPGPPLTILVQVQVIELVEMNRNAVDGTLIRSAAAAVRVLAALHQTSLGSCMLYALPKKAIQPLPMRDGFVAHLVRLQAKFCGLGVPARPSAVQVELAGGAGGVTVSGILSPPGLPAAFQYAGIYNGRPHYTSDGLPYDGTNARTCGAVVYDGGAWRVWWIVEAAMFPMYWAGDVSGAVDPEDGIYSNLVYGSGIPTVSVTPGSALTLTCASPSSSIRYTTDGSYPSPAKTLYAAPFATPAAGTVIRAAAYVSGQPPGDVLEFTVTE